MNNNNNLADFDLNKKLQSFSISSEEEKITKELQNTHLTNKDNNPPSIFSITNATTTTKPTQPVIEKQPKQDEEESGWGEGPPSYTSISQGTYFGFNSLIHSELTVTSASPSASQAFSQYKDKPVTFTSTFTNK